MTNFIKIHCMTEEKLAEFLSELDKAGEGLWWKWFDDNCCKKCEEKGVFVCDEGGCAFDDSLKVAILGWLESEYVEDGSDEVKTET